jgi:UDPglucose 6-dehydrogenase
MTVAVGVVGLSHLGIVTGTGLASLGFPVVAVDSDAEVVKALAAARPPVHEPGLPELLARSGAAFTTDYAGLERCGVVLLAADTVTDDRDCSELSSLEAHVDKILPWLAADTVLVLMSQVPVGYTRDLAERLRARRPDFRGPVYYWVETLVIGDAVARFRAPERIILGGAEAEWEPDARLRAVLDAFACPKLRMSYESAELTKAAINLYLSTSLTFANALADLCEASGASMRSILPALRSDARIGPRAYIRPGLGIGGGNLERDLVNLGELAARLHVDGSLLELILKSSRARYGWLTRAVERHLLAGRSRPRIALWGGVQEEHRVDTQRAEPASARRPRGRADVSAYDPAARVPPDLASVAASALEAAHGADGLVVLTDWDEFAAQDLRAVRAALRAPVVVDGVGVLDPAAVAAAGLRYVGIGEPA